MEEKKNVEKSPERLAVLDRIARLELEGKFDVDAEEESAHTAPSAGGH